MKANETKTVGAEIFSTLVAAVRESLEDGNTDLVCELVNEIFPGAELVEAEILLFGRSLLLTLSSGSVTVYPVAL